MHLTVLTKAIKILFQRKLITFQISWVYTKTSLLSNLNPALVGPEKQKALGLGTPSQQGVFIDIPRNTGLLLKTELLTANLM